jgi:hypothetical protein
MSNKYEHAHVFVIDWSAVQEVEECLAGRMPLLVDLSASARGFEQYPHERK